MLIDGYVVSLTECVAVVQVETNRVVTTTDDVGGLESASTRYVGQAPKSGAASIAEPDMEREKLVSSRFGVRDAQAGDFGSFAAALPGATR